MVARYKDVDACDGEDRGTITLWETGQREGRCSDHGVVDSMIKTFCCDGGFETKSLRMIWLGIHLWIDCARRYDVDDDWTV